MDGGLSGPLPTLDDDCPPSRGAFSTSQPELSYQPLSLSPCTAYVTAFHQCRPRATEVIWSVALLRFACGRLSSFFFLLFFLLLASFSPYFIKIFYCLLAQDDYISHGLDIKHGMVYLDDDLAAPLRGHYYYTYYIIYKRRRGQKAALGSG
jgi:hypothetical protein